MLAPGSFPWILSRPDCRTNRETRCTRAAWTVLEPSLGLTGFEAFIEVYPLVTPTLPPPSSSTPSCVCVGLLPNILGVTPEKAIKLAVNDSMRALLARQHRCLDAELPILHGMVKHDILMFIDRLASNPNPPPLSLAGGCCGRSVPSRGHESHGDRQN